MGRSAGEERREQEIFRLEAGTCAERDPVAGRAAAAGARGAGTERSAEAGRAARPPRRPKPLGRAAGQTGQAQRVTLQQPRGDFRPHARPRGAAVVLPEIRREPVPARRPARATHLPVPIHQPEPDDSVRARTTDHSPRSRYSTLPSDEEKN